MAYHSSEIHKKLEGFIKKFYKNQIIKGALLSVSVILAFYVIVVSLEYYGKYSSNTRLFLLVAFLLVSGTILGKFIIMPLLSLIRLRKRLSLQVASKFIGAHFTEIQDKLLNLLELNNFKDVDNSLVLASIEQKTAELKPIDFKRAIDYKKNQKYLRFLIPIFLGFLGLYLVFPALINLGTKRIVNYDKTFKNTFPFAVFFDNPLEGVVGDDFILNFHLDGKDLPENIYIEYNNKRYKAESINKKQYSFTFPKIGSDVPFKIIADDEEYDEFAVRAVNKPSIRSMNLIIDYPAYLNMKDEVITNPSDFTVPEGTKLTWNIMAENSDEIKVYALDTMVRIKSSNASYVFSNQVFRSDVYSFLPWNKDNRVKVKDSLSASINVIPDLYPTIDITETKDSVFLSLLNFEGNIKDDYGLKLLKFHYVLKKSDNEEVKNNVPIGIAPGLVSQGFKYPFDTKMLDMHPGDKLTYYFEVFDNDGVHGPKSTRSITRVFSIPTEDEIKNNIDKRNETIKDDLADSKSLSDDLQKQIDELQKSLLQKKELSWDDKKKLQDILDKQQEMKDKIDDVQKKQDINNIQENELTDDEKRLMDKQDEIDKLFDELNNDDLNKMMDELNKMMDKMDKTKMMDMLDKMEMSNNDLEKELDRTLSLFKQMQFDNKLDETINKLDELIKEQENFMKDAENKDISADELKDKQDFIDKKMDELKEDLKELGDMNEGLEEKQDLSGLEEKMNESESEMDNSKNELGKNQKGKSSKSMKGSQGKNQEMKDQLEQMQSESESEQSAENMEDLRQLLDNTLKLSFDQEALIKSTNETNINNPQFKDILKEQKKLLDDSKVIEDSLLALSKRVIQIQSLVNKEVGMVKNSMEKSLDYLEDRNKSSSVQKQQYALTSLNNLALLLSEAIQQMQQQMMQQQQQDGSKACKKPGSAKPGQGKKPSDMQGLLQKQMALQQKMQDLQGKMQGQKGQKPGEGENGDVNKDLVKLANEQELIRKELQDLSKDLQGDQKKQINDIIKKMEENETDILNKKISGTTIKRNEEITIKMMDSEKAMRNQDQDEKRKSNEGEDKDNNNNKILEDYFKKKNLELEIIRTIPPVMRPYYKSKVSQYLNNF